MPVVKILDAVTAVSVSTPDSIEGADLQSRTNATVVQCTAVGGSGTALAALEGSLDGIGWTPLVNFSLTPTSSTVTDGVHIDTLWLFIRGNVTQIPSGCAITMTIYRV